VLAVVALPRMEGALAQRSDHWRDQVLAALRHAQATAQSHRRLVCATVVTDAVTLSMATANPATACTTALPGADGQAAHASDRRLIATQVSPAGMLFSRQPHHERRRGRHRHDRSTPSRARTPSSYRGDRPCALSGVRRRATGTKVFHAHRSHRGHRRMGP
jgi:hypothetical protein